MEPFSQDRPVPSTNELCIFTESVVGFTDATCKGSACADPSAYQSYSSDKVSHGM